MSKKESHYLVVDVLRQAPYFAGLEEEVLLDIADAAVRYEYPAGSLIFNEGESCHGLYFVEEGWLKIVKYAPDGRELSLRIVGSGEFFGEIGVFACTVNPATVIALDSVVLWVIEREKINNLLEKYPRMALRILRNLSRRMMELVALIEDLSLWTVESRLARYLLRYADANGRVVRRRWATQREMAARLGTVLHVLNRALHTLESEGLISVDRYEIRILDRERLRHRAVNR